MDWLLAAHQVAPLQFEMGGLWNPVSVRDQMVRGQELARRAVIAGLLDGARPLIVVGAGAGGMAAAVTAHDAGVPVIVIERSPRPFERQLGAPTRTIYPYLYDWPHGRYAGLSLAAPAVLPWNEARADQAAHQWITALGARRLVAYGSTVSPPSPGGAPVVVSGNVVNVHVATPAGSGWLHGGMLLSSVGFGTEITWVPSTSGTYHGWRFWKRDAIGSPNLGLTKLPVVVIAGGGDGALQDTLRVLLKAPYENIRELVAALPQIPHNIRLSIADADDIATRSWLWATGRADDCPILDALHHRVEDTVDVWWSRDHATIAAALDPLWRADVASVRLVHGCTHFGRSFALNRFLLLLLERAAQDRTERELAAREDALVRGESRPPEAAPVFVRTPGHFLVSVDGGTGHTCSAVPPCPGRHEARFAVATCATPRGAVPPPSMTAPADRLILRGGVAAPASPLASSPISNRRQYLPDRPR